jgi:hypothetical protein
MASASGCEAPFAIVRFSIVGSSAVEQSIGPAMSGTPGFEDGWTVRFSKFLVVLKDITVADAMGTVVSKQPGAKAYDLTKPGPVEVYAGSAAAKQYDNVSYALASDAAVEAGNVEPGDLALLKSRGASLIVAGSATSAMATKTFDWTFTTNTQYESCERAEMGGKGVLLNPGQTVMVRLTIQGERFFSDQLSSEGVLRFTAVADSDSNGDGRLTFDELAAVQLDTLPSGQYGTTQGSSVRNLRDFVMAQSRRIGRFDGTGTCQSRAR